MVRWVMCCLLYHASGGIPIGVFGQWSLWYDNSVYTYLLHYFGEKECVA